MRLADRSVIIGKGYRVTEAGEQGGRLDSHGRPCTLPCLYWSADDRPVTSRRGHPLKTATRSCFFCLSQYIHSFRPLKTPASNFIVPIFFKEILPWKVHIFTILHWENNIVMSTSYRKYYDVSCTLHIQTVFITLLFCECTFKNLKNWIASLKPEELKLFYCWLIFIQDNWVFDKHEIKQQLKHEYN